jgi:UDP-N-acetylmuramoyl-tripeptide--D-alanyl-D-alanine ligase
MSWRLEDIVSAAGGRLLYGGGAQGFGGIGIDSRTIGAGDFFVAICGATHDGHRFIPQVVAKGVRGIMVQDKGAIRPDHGALEREGVACVAVSDTTRALGALAAFVRRRMQIPVVAITGSNGKTTTRRMTALIMDQQYKTLATEGNLNNEIGLPLTLFRLTADHQAAVLELGTNHPGEIDRLGAICRPTIGLITNVGPAHLEFFGNIQTVARAKAELLAHIAPGGYAVLNKDDQLVSAMADQAPCRVLYFGTASGAEIRAESIQETAAGVRFRLILPDDRLDIALRSPGRFMVSNALAAAAAGHAAGVEARAIQAGLESFAPVKGRLDVVTAANQVHIIDDTYNANPSSMAAAIQTLAVLKGSNRGYIVLGDMLELGDRAPTLHRQVGALAGKSGAAKVYACGRYAEDVIAGARQAGMTPGQLTAAAKEEIAALLIGELQTGDWVLVKGSRGMAMETVVEAVLNWARKASGKPEKGGNARL